MKLSITSDLLTTATFEPTSFVEAASNVSALLEQHSQCLPYTNHRHYSQQAGHINPLMPTVAIWVQL